MKPYFGHFGPPGPPKTPLKPLSTCLSKCFTAMDQLVPVPIGEPNDIMWGTIRKLIMRRVECNHILGIWVPLVP